MKWLLLMFLVTVSLDTSQAQTVRHSSERSKDAAASTTDREAKAQSRSPTETQQQTLDNKPGGQENQTSKIGVRAHDWIEKLNAVSTLAIAAFTILLFLAVIASVNLIWPLSIV